MTDILEEDDLHAVEALKQFDLNEYEAKTFVVLLRMDNAPASEISDAADVPKSRVYDVLSALEKKGLVTKQPSSPKKYSANHARRSLEHLLYRVEKSYEERLSHLRNQKDQLTDLLPDRAVHEQNSSKISTVEGTYAVACKLIEGMQDCEESMRIAGDSPFVRLKSRSAFDNQIGDTPVDIRATGLFDDDEVTEMRRHDALIRESEEIIQSFFVFDEEVLLQVHDSGSSLVGLWTDEKSMIRTYLDRFETLWKQQAPQSFSE